jgi:hypothetical protein
VKLTISLFSFAILGGFALGDKITFDEARTGAAPAGWTATQTGTGSARWTVEKDDSAPSKPHVLQQAGEATFPVCLKNDTHVKDGFVEVKLKPVSGKEDQAGGVVWRAADADNYYIARANALEDNVSIYHTIKGRRVEFKSIKERVKSGVWHILRVDFRGDKFTVIFDGKKVLEANDGTFKDGGKVGVWTKADSVTLFDDFVFGE